jgi:hypothetical protein
MPPFAAIAASEVENNHRHVMISKDKNQTARITEELKSKKENKQIETCRSSKREVKEKKKIKHACSRFMRLSNFIRRAFSTSCSEALALRLRQNLVGCGGAHRFLLMRHCASPSHALVSRASLGGVSRLHLRQALPRAWLVAERAGLHVGPVRPPCAAPHLSYVRHHPDAEVDLNAP